jgi:hypothetical protein
MCWFFPKNLERIPITLKHTKLVIPGERGQALRFARRG